MQQTSLDPQDWDAFRALSHEMLDDMFDHLAGLAEAPAWRPYPPEVKARILGEPVPMVGQGERAAYDAFVRDIMPYPSGNAHPRFFGWVQGPGVPLANMADFLASGLNPHGAGFNQTPALVEQRVIEWMIELMGFPANSSGVLESGGTMANILGLAVARHAKSGFDVREEGLQGGDSPVAVYCSAETHGWITKGVELLGIGSRFLRKIPVDDEYRMDIPALRQTVAADLSAGIRPICVVGTAGTVNTGATDDLNALADLCREHDIWFHVDGAFGALARLSPNLAPLVAGIERADSVAFDLHKWMYLPFEIACVLVRDPAAHVGTFALAPSYIAGLARGVIAGGLPFSDRGVDLSRSFKALKAWMCIKAYGVQKFGEIIERNVLQTRLLVSLIRANPNLELLAPAPMNIACFRYIRSGLSTEELNALNLEVLFRVQETGDAVPSSTMIGGNFAIRACNVNHRTTDGDIHRLVESVLRHGSQV